jgi:predicted nucleic acid-binding protein
MEIPGMVVLDCNALITLCGPECDDKHRLEHLLAELDKRKGRVVLPTPAIAEFLVKADSASLGIQKALMRRSGIVVGNLDMKAAVELSLIDGSSIGRGDKKDSVGEPWQKIKIDRQLVAIAKVAGAELIVSGDQGVATVAMRVNIECVRVEDLPFPDSARQGKIEYVEPADPKGHAKK